MNYFSPLHLVVYGFLLLTLIVGLYSGRNVKTFKDYTTANKSLGTGVLTMTLLATIVGSVELIRPGQVYDWAKLIGPIGVVKFYIPAILPILFLAPWLPGKLIAHRLLNYHDCVTMGSVMGKLYGTTARKFTGLVSAVACL